MDGILIKKIVGVVFICVGIYSIGYCLSIMAYGVTFSKFFAALGVLFTLIGIGTLLFQEKYLEYIPSSVITVFKIGVMLFICSFIIIEGLIVYHGGRRDTEKVDYLVILGAGLWGDRPSLALIQRLDEGLSFIKVNPGTKIIVSGGMGSGETITEAEAMKRYLVEKGVDERLIIKEDRSTSTKENMKYTRELLNKLDGRENIKIQVVTNNFHMFRSKLLAKDNGFQAYGQPAPLHPLLIPAYYIREYIAVIKSFVFDFF
jgi:uncharacterized SAM-binding protein YcdF (DUF218 family)